MVKKIKKSSKKTQKNKKKKFVYVAPTADQLKRRGEQTGGNFEGIFKNDIKLFRPKAGENCIRILPATWDGHEHCGLEVYVHSFIGPNNGTFLCLKKMKNQQCPVCDAAEDAKRSGEADEAQELQARKRVLYWVIDRDEEDEGSQIYDASWTIDRDIFSLAVSRSGKVRLVDHPDTGHDVIFHKQGEKLKTRYFGFQIEPEKTPIFDDEDEQDKVLEYIQDNPIPDILVYRDAEYLERVLSGTVSDDDEDDEDEDDDDDVSSRRKSKSKPRKTSRRRSDDDEDEDDDEDDEDEDDDEDDVDEDDDDDEDDDEDDEEEVERRPKKSSKSRKTSKAKKNKPSSKGSSRSRRFGRTK